MKTYKTWPLVILSSLAIVSPSYAAVVVAWEQIGDDVTATWSGLLSVSIQETNSYNTFASNIDDILINRERLLSRAPNTQIASATVGARYDIPTSYGFWGIGGSGGDGNTSNGVTFGHIQGGIFYNEELISQQNGSLITEFSYNSVDHVMTFSGTTLEAMGADTFDSLVVLTVDATGDTISYNTGPLPVPEPSTGLMAMFGLSALVFRRRRAKVTPFGG
ncbi:PEP-CTERM sorting domain-containing protein [Akkermansiaceae bacterium]|nr:PEP-CTERM sorting domain-containing protein [Akkermansiaceae bacterium]MDB4570447.1 PEP-CTERM sorting domain-containing protein [Akkermansiaceae bacterium]